MGGSGAPFALDYSAIMSVGAAMAVDLDMLADVLPAADAAIVKRYLPGEEGGGDE